MLKGLLSKIKVKFLLEIFIGIIIVSTPFFINHLNNPSKFNFTLNSNEQIFVLPEVKEKPILEFLNKAKESVDITIYLLSDNIIINKIKELHKKGVAIRIIIEKTPYGGGAGNYKVYNELKNLGINIKYSNPIFALTHAKYIVIDKEEAFIMTANLTYSGLNKDRDFILHTTESNIIKELNNIFEADFNYKKYNSKLDNLVISPNNSRLKIEGLIKSAKKSIYIYGENIQDKSIENLLIQKASRNIEVKMIFPDSKKLESNKPVIERLKSANIKLFNLKKPYQHAKILIVDNSIMYLGSINYSTYSMDRNREVGIVTLNQESIKTVLDTFNKDFIIK